MSGETATKQHPGDLAPRIMQVVGILVLRATARFLYRAQVRRAGPLPTGPCVYAANHRSFYDPLLVGMCHRVAASYFARDSLWRNPFIGTVLNIMYGIPIDRVNPGMSSMSGAIDKLRRGIPVLIFPEGTRTRTGRVTPLRDGPALFARRAGVPIVPVYVHRSDLAWPRGRILPRLGVAGVQVRFGSPIRAPAGLPPRQQDAWVTRRLQAWMELQERRLLGPRKTSALRAGADG
ncbi:MAG: 1-acyl-sn-glycerol-3-phosphate acyltransferase [Planctomycetes bacterium]|nr:1-acyl-sn-glycerol-3-phosphate acyltransferase [Planctomycetota bacterium]